MWVMRGVDVRPVDVCVDVCEGGEGSGCVCGRLREGEWLRGVWVELMYIYYIYYIYLLYIYINH